MNASAEYAVGHFQTLEIIGAPDEVKCGKAILHKGGPVKS